MRKLVYSVCLPVLFAIVISPSVFSRPVFAINRIEGVVYDPNRVPVNDVRVELQNEVGSLLTTTITRSGGRFTFVGVSSGRFLIHSIAIGKDFLEETTSVEVANFGRATSSDTAYVEVYLRYDKRSSDRPVTGRAEALFVQDVPKEARKLYQLALDDIKENPDKGILDLEEAIKIYPNYFDALAELGRVYIERKDYRKGYPYLLQAIDANQRSSACYYNLGLAFYKLNEVPAGLTAAKAATIIEPTFLDAQILYGILLRMNGNYKDAESTLLKAQSLAKTPVPEIHWQLALVYNRLNRNQDAIKELEIYLKTNPDTADRKKTEELIAKLRGAKQS